MASERGTKRTDPDTGKKFYDLNQDPIVSPYTGKSYPRSFFETLPGKPSPVTARKVDDEEQVEEEEVEDTAAPEIVSLEEADAEMGLEQQDLPAHRTRRDAEFLAGERETRVAGRCLEGTQGVQRRQPALLLG